MDATTYTIPLHNVEAVVAALDKLAKRAARKGLPALVYTLGEVEEVARPCRRDGESATVQARALTVQTPVLRYQGWRLLATLDFTLGGGEPLVSAAGDVTVPACYRHADNSCDHCKADRRRQLCVVLQHEDGRTTQVGRQCVRDFLGHDAEALVAAHDLAHDVALACEAAQDEGWTEVGGYRVRPTWDLHVFLAYVAACIRCGGWVSRKTARAYEEAGGYKLATSDEACGVWFRAQAGKSLDNDPRPTDADRETAGAAIAWGAALEPTSDYEHNLRRIADAGCLRHQHAGVAASLVASYLRHVQQLAERARLAATSTHLGTVGARLVLTLTCVGVPRELESDWGVTSLCTFASADGSVVKWFCSGAPPDWFEDGSTLRLRATIKKHDAWRGVAQTVLSRVTVEPTDEERAAAKAAAKAASKARAARKRVLDRLLAEHAAELVCPVCGQAREVVQASGDLLDLVCRGTHPGQYAYETSHRQWLPVTWLPAELR